MSHPGFDADHTASALIAQVARRMESGDLEPDELMHIVMSQTHPDRALPVIVSLTLQGATLLRLLAGATTGDLEAEIERFSEAGTIARHDVELDPPAED